MAEPQPGSREPSPTPAEGLSSGPWNLIPQLFYDLVARVFPGGVLLIIACVIHWGSVGLAKQLKENHEWIFGAGPFLLFFGAAYLCGLLVGEVADPLMNWRFEEFLKKREDVWKERCLKEHERLLSQFHLQPLPLALKHSNLPRWYVMHDHLREVIGFEATRLLKTRAELQASRVLTIGFVILFVYNTCVMWHPNRLGFRLEFGLALLVAAGLSFFQMLRDHEYLMTGVSVLWLSLASSGRLKFQARERASFGEEA